jgi:hypothetical protein
MNDHSVPEFWDIYIAIARLYKVRDNALRWYVRHAERYISTLRTYHLVNMRRSRSKLFFVRKAETPILKAGNIAK